MPAPLPRSKVRKEQTWNAESVFPSPEAFDAEVQNILAWLPEIKKFQGRLGKSVDTFLEAMRALDTLEQRSMKVRVYATMSNGGPLQRRLRRRNGPRPRARRHHLGDLHHASLH